MMRMTMQEAKELLEENRPNLKVLSCVEYERLYVFNTEGKNHGSNMNNLWVGGLIAIDSVSGEMFGFNPMMLNPSKYFEAAKKDLVKF